MKCCSLKKIDIITWKFIRWEYTIKHWHWQTKRNARQFDRVAMHLYGTLVLVIATNIPIHANSRESKRERKSTRVDISMKRKTVGEKTRGWWQCAAIYGTSTITHRFRYNRKIKLRTLDYSSECNRAVLMDNVDDDHHHPKKVSISSMIQIPNITCIKWMIIQLFITTIEHKM